MNSLVTTQQTLVDKNWHPANVKPYVTASGYRHCWIAWRYDDDTETTVRFDAAWFKRTEVKNNGQRMRSEWYTRSFGHNGIPYYVKLPFEAGHLKLIAWRDFNSSVVCPNIDMLVRIANAS